VARIAKVKAAVGELPIERLLRRMREPGMPEPYKDSLAIALLPFTARRVAGGTVLDPKLMSDRELDDAINLAERSVSGRPALRVVK
jgi:hypothetical protein